MQQPSLNFDSPHLLSDEEAVLSCLGHGRQAATSSTIIEARTGLRPRRVQQIIRKLRLEGHNIGSATTDPMGYFLTDAQDENKVRGDWCFQFQHRGRRYAGRGHGSRREAAAAEAERRKDVSAQIKTQTGTDFVAVANVYLDWAERRFAKATFWQKRDVYKQYVRINGNLDLHNILPSEIHSYLSTRAGNNQYNVHRKELSALFTYARRVLKIDCPNPCTEIERLPYTPKGKAIYTEEELLKLILAADPASDEQGLVLVVIHTMARIGEVLRLRWQDVNFERRELVLWTRKRKGGDYEPDTQPMNDELHRVLWGRWKAKQSDEWVFVNEETGTRYQHRPKLMKGLCKRAGIPNHGFHALRHSIASYLADKGKVSLKTLSGLLRHKSLKTTEIYLHALDDSKRAAISEMDAIFTPISSKLQPAPATKKEKEPHNEA